MDIAITCTSEKVTIFLLKIVGCLLLANLAGIYLKWNLGYITALGFVPLFDFDQEYNIPSLYSTLAILSSAALLWFIAQDETSKASRGMGPYWRVLSFIFLFLSFDELNSIHNHFSSGIRIVLDSIPLVDSLPRVRLWILAYLPCLFLFYMFFFKFLLKLPSATRIRFFVAGFIYVAGAVGLELVSGLYIYYYYQTGFNWGVLIGTLEELLEMIGIILFIRALLDYIVTHSVTPRLGVQVSFASTKEKAALASDVLNTYKIDLLNASN